MKKTASVSVPTLNPDTLGRTVFSITGWQSMQGPYHRTFHINRIETVRQVLNFPMPPHRKTVCDFIFVTQGSMVRWKGLTRYEVPRNTGFFLPPHQISFDEWMSEDIQGYYCHFDANLFAGRWAKQEFDLEFPFFDFNGNPLVTLDNKSVDHVTPLIRRLETEYSKGQGAVVDLFRVYLLALLLEVKQVALTGAEHPADTPGDRAAYRITQLYKHELGQHIAHKQLVADYAALLHVSPNHLNKCVKATTGQSARELLDEMLILEAKVLLVQSTLSISEIAYRIGQQDPSNFSRFFRLKTGLTPKQYRGVD